MHHVGQANIVLRSNDLAIQAQAARAGVGIALLPEFMARDGVQPLPEQTSPLAVEVWVAVHEDLRHAPRIRATLDLLAECFSAGLS